MKAAADEGAVRIISSFEDISDAARRLRGIPYVRQYADGIERASMAIIDEIIREIGASERKIRTLETALSLYRREAGSLPEWRPIDRWTK